MREIILTLFILFTSLGSFAQGVLTTTVSSLDFGGDPVSESSYGPNAGGNLQSCVYRDFRLNHAYRAGDADCAVADKEFCI